TTGTRPFEGDTPEQTVEAILTGKPVPPRQRNHAIPAKLERIIVKALEKDRTARYQIAAELRAELQRLQPATPRVARWPLGATGDQWVFETMRRFPGVLLLTLVVLVIGTRAGWWSAPTPAIAPETRQAFEIPVRRVAVLPLRSLSGGPDQELLAEGIGDAIAADLARLQGLRVIAGSSAGEYRKTSKGASQIARELRVDLLIAGSAIVTGPRLEVRLHLTRAGSDAPFWSERFDADFRATGAIRNEVARAVAREVRLRLSPGDEARLVKEGTASREAFENYLRARHFWTKRTDQDIQRAVGFFKTAIDADPAYAPAYAGLADCYNQFATVQVGRPPGENRGLAIAFAKKAIEIDGENAEAHAALGFAKLYNWEWAGAELELRRALDLNPSYASAHVWRASSLLIRRRFDEAFAEVDRAGELDPLSPITQTQVGWIRALAGRSEKAIAQYRKVLANHPDYPWALWLLGAALSETGRAREAIEILRKASVVTKNNPAHLGSLGMAYGIAGRHAEAREILALLRRLSKERYVTPHAPAHVCLGLGDLGCFFEALEEGYRQRINYMAYLSVVPSPANYGAVRADPRFQDLLRRLGYDRE
ncbi:MAG: tetratricopeptide repeat protein, partial [Bryobacteraceae bacterium]